MDKQDNNPKLKHFLLGSAGEKDAEEIGVRLIADREMEEQMSLAELNLIEDFLDGALTAEEKELFRANFLTTPARIELLKETAGIRNYARSHPAEDSEYAAEEKKSGGLFENFRRFLSLNLRPVAAVLLILALGAIVWRVVFYDAGGLSATEREYAALNAKDLATAPDIANLTSQSLISGTFRDADTGAKLKAETLTEKVLFRLVLPAGTPPDASLNLELIRGGQTVFRQKNLKVYQNPGGQELKVILPKTVLTDGNYRIKLGNGLTYGFTVE